MENISFLESTKIVAINNNTNVASRMPTDHDLKEELKHINEYVYKDAFKWVFDNIENYNNPVLISTKPLQSEHLLPQANAKWIEQLGTIDEEYEEYLNKLGNAKIVEGLMHGVYVFVENHVCINDTKYIEFDLFNNIQLTEYARNNIDECCIKFKFYTESIKQDAGFAYFCYLNRDCNEGFKFTLDLPTDGNDKVLGNAELAKRFSKRTENIAKMQKIAGMTFTEALNYLIEFVGMDTGALVCRTGLDERTIRRYIKGEIKKPTKTSVVAICRGLKIPIIISKLLLDRAGLALIAGDKYDDAYELILTVMLENDIVSVNKFLRDIGVPPLSEEQ